MTQVFTSTTAPGKVFSSRAQLAEHYKSDWHKYNLKRREAGLPLLERTDFQARWEAALALRTEKEAKERTGTDHLKNSKKNKKKKQQQLLQQPEDKQKPQNKDPSETVTDIDTASASSVQGPKQLKPDLAASQENAEIEPKQCLFDSHISDSLEQNIQYMQKNYGFFIPDRGKLFDESTGHSNS
jgi:pre-60S factor REI1